MDDDSNKSDVNENRSINETLKHKRDSTTKEKGKVSAKRGRKKNTKGKNDDNDDDDDEEHL